MTDRKPDFYVVKREGLDGLPEWFTFDADGHVWDYQLTLRHRFVTEADAAKIAKKYGGSVVPVFCTSKRAEPRMCERSSAWVLKRLAEGKMVLIARDDGPPGMYRWTVSRVDSRLEERFECEPKWTECSRFQSVHGRVKCRVAKDEEIPK